MTVTAPSYKTFLEDLGDVAELARDDVRDLRDELYDLPVQERVRALRKHLRRAVYRHAVRTCWFETPSLIDTALVYADRYAIDDDAARCFIRRGCAQDPIERKRALLVACIYHHVTHRSPR